MPFKDMSLYDLLVMKGLEVEEQLTKAKFQEIRNYGTEQELIDAVVKMEMMGGYDALD